MFLFAGFLVPENLLMLLPICKIKSSPISTIQTEINKKLFDENMETSEFTFCPRGNGNFSIRFYESLYSGRIPIIIKLVF